MMRARDGLCDHVHENDVFLYTDKDLKKKNIKINF